MSFTHRGMFVLLGAFSLGFGGTALALVPGARPWLISAVNDYKTHWRKDQLLLVFASGDSEPEYHRQLADVSRAEPDLSTHGVVVISVLPGVSGGDDLRARYQIREAAPFTAVLVGKDGAEKTRSYRMIPAEKVVEVLNAHEVDSAKAGAVAHTGVAAQAGVAAQEAGSRGN
jgi:hypothetical protein